MESMRSSEFKDPPNMYNWTRNFPSSFYSFIWSIYFEDPILIKDFTHIYSFNNRCSLNSHSVPSPVKGSKNKVLNKVSKIPAFIAVTHV